MAGVATSGGRGCNTVNIDSIETQNYKEYIQSVSENAMTITEFREKIDRMIEDADERYVYICRKNNYMAADYWCTRRDTLVDIQAWASQLNGEI